MLFKLTVGAAAWTAAAVCSQAQMIAVSNGPNGYLWYVDVAKGERIPLAPALGDAVAVDDANGLVYIATAGGSGAPSTLSAWAYDSPDAPVVVGSVQIPGDPSFRIKGLAFGGGRLFAASFAEGGDAIFEIDPATLATTLVVSAASLSTSVEGLAFDATASLFYAAEYKPFASSNCCALLQLDLLGSGAVAPLPVPANLDIDLGGLAVAGGLAYLVPDDFAPVQVVDTASGLALASQTSPFAQDGLASGAEWAPSYLPPRGPRLYCAAKKASGKNYVPFLDFAGDASASAGSGFELLASYLEPNQPLFFVYSVQGKASLPFDGGTLCVAPPFARLAGMPLASFDQPSALDFNAHIASGSDLALGVGQQVWIQAVVLDTAFPFGEGFGLTQGLTTVIKH